ncbi:MAG: asparagine synthetase B family protein, partial [Tepidisphaeraceae bacterium]
MCGFAGLVSWDDRFRVGRDVLERMSAAVAHRGPDGAGLYINHEGPVSRARPFCGLVHRRLAILDLDERALQPFENELCSRWLVFNGEIYNFRDLRDQIGVMQTARGDEPRWRTTCDTEVLLAAYDAWGGGCVDRFNGMFAFAVWDQIAGELFLARDRMGQKPLYYALAPENRAIAFASELGALRHVPWVDRTVDFGAVAEYLRWGYVAAPRTIYAGAAKLAP